MPVSTEDMCTTSLHKSNEDCLSKKRKKIRIREDRKTDKFKKIPSEPTSSFQLQLHVKKKKLIKELSIIQTVSERRPGKRGGIGFK